jgi:hypothetical protein
LCYTHIVRTERLFWNDWLGVLQRRGCKEVVAALLDASGPLTILAGQFIQIGMPFTHSQQLQAFAELLENPQESQEFVRFLRQDEVKP